MATYAAYPGQDEEVRVAVGRTVWIYSDGDKFAVSRTLTWRDKPYPEATHFPEEFIKVFPVRPNGAVYHEARRAGVFKGVNTHAWKREPFYGGCSYVCQYCGHTVSATYPVSELETTSGAVNILDAMMDLANVQVPCGDDDE